MSEQERYDNADIIALKIAENNNYNAQETAILIGGFIEGVKHTQPPLSPETIEVIRELIASKLDSRILRKEYAQTLKQAQVEFNKAYGGGEWLIY